MMTEPTQAPVSDANLITATRSGDAQAYGILYERHAAAARRVAGQLVGGPADVDDVVAETFARVLRVIRRGGGPAEAFRPYLLTAVRRVASDHLRGQRRQIPIGEENLPDPGEPFVDPVVTSLDRSLIARAFRSLPERWTAVLWHTEVEECKPAEVALLLGLTANGVAALRYRAREGLRQAYLQMHLSGIEREACRPVASKLGAYVRGGLSRREGRLVDSHLRSCADCRAAQAELRCINGSLRGLLAPVFLGAVATAYLSGGGPSAAAHGGSAAGPGVSAARMHWLRAVLQHRPAVSLAAGTLLTAAAIPLIAHAHLPPGARPVGVAPIVQAPRFQLPGTSAGPAAATPSKAPAGSGGPLPGTSPTPSATVLPSAAPTPGQTAPLLAARLGVQVDVNGVLGLGLVATVVVRVADTGTEPTSALTANLTLPSGIDLLGLTGGGSGSQPWTCSTNSAGATSCTHGPIAAGTATSATVQVLVTALSGCGSGVLATVVSGTLSASGQSASVVQCGGKLFGARAVSLRLQADR